MFHPVEKHVGYGWTGAAASTWAVAAAIAVLGAVVFSCMHRRRNRNRPRVSAPAPAVPGVTVEDPLPNYDLEPPASMEDIQLLKGSLSAGSIFGMKRAWLKRKLAVTLPPIPHPPLEIMVRRDHVVQDSFVQFSGVKDEDLRRHLSLHYIGEMARDDGGVTRDWLTTLSKEIINPAYALFVESSIDNYTYQVSSLSHVNPEHLDFFRFIGMVIGKAIYEGLLLDCHFTSLTYKRMLGRQLTFEDIASADAEYHRSLSWLLENNLEGLDLGMTFITEEDNFGETRITELKPGGANIPLCEDNKAEYVELLSQWWLRGRVEKQCTAMREGLSRLVLPELLTAFDEMELEWLIGGLPELDVNDWRRNTVYKSGYADDGSCPVITWFWEMVESWEQEMRARLLQFVTGTSKVPYPEGFAGLRGSDGPRRFHIVQVTDVNRLPQAHTCFNELIMPPYPTYDRLNKALNRAIAESGQYFGLR
eukprot:jgi/Mesvir1/2316/Mv19347-RA.1